MNDLTHTSETTYDYSRLSAPAKEESEIGGFTAFIAEKIRERRTKRIGGVVRRFTRSTLAEIIGIDLSA